MTADESHLRGSWFLCGLHTLAENCSWARDVDGRDQNETLVRLEAVSAFWVHSSFECLSPEYCTLQQHLCCYCGFAVFANDSRTRSILLLSQLIIGVAGILSGVHFSSPKKLTTFFQLSLSKHTLKLSKYVSSTAQISPNLLKNWTLELPRGCTFCLGCTYKFPL